MNLANPGNAFKNSEEKYPLLYLIVDKENGYPNPSNNRRFFEKRYGIPAGVSNVFERWPGYIGTCWISSTVTILALFSMFVLFMTALSAFRVHRIPRCVPNHNPMLDNSTIHLVHGLEPWKQLQFDMIEKIIQVFPSNRIHLILIKKPTLSDGDFLNNAEATSAAAVRSPEIVKEKELVTQELTTATPALTENTASASRKLMRISDESDFSGKDDDRLASVFHDSLLGWPFLGPKDFISNLLKRSLQSRTLSRNKQLNTTPKPAKITNISALLVRHPSIYLEILTYEEAFEKSPLFLTWHHLNDGNKIFAIRVLQLWQYGGLSFDLEQIKNGSNDAPDTHHQFKVAAEKEENEDSSEESRAVSNTYIDSLLYLGYSNFQMIPGGIVTLAENGCHMETKSACHSFFGEVLSSLKEANVFTSPEDVIRGALKYFLKPSSSRRSFIRKS